MGFSFCRFGRIIYKGNSERKETNNEEFYEEIANGNWWNLAISHCAQGDLCGHHGRSAVWPGHALSTRK